MWFYPYAFVLLSPEINFKVRDDYNNIESLTIGIQPTTLPPPTPSPLRIQYGRLAIRAITK